MGTHVHRLLERDPVTRRGVCAACGPVALLPKSGGRLACATARRQDRSRVPGGADVKAQHGHKIMEPHGLTRGEMKEFVAGKQCEICSSTENLVVDHCHAELKIRGVLCRKCNAVLGLMGDNPARLRAAAAYLER